MNETNTNPASRNLPLRSMINHIAEQRNLLRHVNNLSNAMAVRYLQEKEGNERCFWRHRASNLISSSYESCNETKCMWRNYCVHIYPAYSGSEIDRGVIQSFSIRDAIDIIAEQRNLADQISELSDINAVRFLQEKEGFTPCFGADTPYHPGYVDQNRCVQAQHDEFGQYVYCVWQSYCNLYRSAAQPLDKTLTTLTNYEVLKLKRVLNSQMNADKFPTDKVPLALRLASFDRIISVTKKIVLSSPNSVFSESLDEAHRLRPYLFDMTMGSGPYPGYERRGGYGHYSTFKVLYTSDLAALENWLTQSQPFIETNNICYLPISKDFDLEEAVSVDRPNLMGLLNKLPTQQFQLQDVNPFATPHLGFQDGDVKLSQPEFAPILNIELPILEDIELKSLSKLMEDYPDELCSFQDFLFNQVNKMRSAVIGSEHFYQDCRGIEREIRDQLRKLESDYKKANLQSAFSLAGGVIATFTLALYCIREGTGNILTILGPGGVVYQLSAAYSEHLKRRLEMKDSPVYFLWLLGKSRRR